MKDDLSRVWKRIDVGSADECWPWQGKCVNDRPQAGTAPHRGKIVPRLIYESEVGAIPRGWYVKQECGNNLCCNPRHLFIESRQEHVSRYVEASPEKWQSGHHGESHRNATLTEADVIHIRDLYATGMEAAQIAARYLLSRDTIYSIVKRRTWARVPPSPLEETVIRLKPERNKHLYAILDPKEVG